MTAAAPATRYVVRHGDTLSGIAARFAVRGGWPALYAANRQALGPDPDVIRPGIVLALPARTTPARYTVAAGDTLSGIAARFAVRGGWPALYAANRQAIGPDPDVIRPGTVLTSRARWLPPRPPRRGLPRARLTGVPRRQPTAGPRGTAIIRGGPAHSRAAARRRGPPRACRRG